MRRSLLPIIVTIIFYSMWLSACNTARDSPRAAKTDGGGARIEIMEDEVGSASGARSTGDDRSEAGVLHAGGESPAPSGVGPADAPAPTVTSAREASTVDVMSKSGRTRASDETVTESSGRAGNQTAGQLTAGEWSDLLEWEYWNGVIADSAWRHMPGHWRFNPRTRLVVRVQSGGRPLCDATVRVENRKGAQVWAARTSNAGIAYAFPEMFDELAGPYTVTAEANGNTTKAMIDCNGSSTELRLSLPEYRSANGLDIMFVVDATGSMGDEMEYLKSELRDVIGRVEKMNSEALDVRLGINVYRDHGDEYVVRSFGFTKNINDALANLANQRAGGGGDFEEAVEEGLADGINKVEWRDVARAKLLFLVLDAPPHHTPERIERLRTLTRDAAAKGIRIVPVAASGINKETEFLLRFLAVSTGGTYTFITDHSGIGGAHLKPTIGQYKVELLNNLLVRLINGYVAA